MRALLDAQHYAHIPLRMSEGDLTEGAARFLRFLEEIEDDVKRKTHYASKFHRGSAVGYSDVRTSPGKDPKEYFHWTPQLYDHSAFDEFCLCYRKQPAVSEFFESAEYLYDRSVVMAREIFQTFPEDLHTHVFDDNNNLVNGHLRFLCYTPSAAAFRAKPHYDKGQGAIALAESCSGLRVGCCDKHPLACVDHVKDHGVFMPGQLLWEQSQREIMPAWHDVEHAADETPISARCARWAIVFFINDRNGYYPEWDAVHQPLPVHGQIAAE